MKLFKKAISAILASLCVFGNSFVSASQINKTVLEREKSKILKLETTYNTRDLGGYETLDGKITKHGVFLRSDDTNKLTKNDIKTLQDYGVKTVIDLRTKNEVKERPDRLAKIRGIDYHRVDIKSNFLKNHNRKDVRFGDGYAHFIDYTGKGNWQKEIFDTIANAKEGCILFHCVHGKDRTGLVSALVLSLVNVDEEDILNNYSVSWDFLKNRPSIKTKMKKDLKKYGKSAKKYHSTVPEKMKPLIDYITENYGTFENYLLACGISQKNLDKIKNKFTKQKEMKNLIKLEKTLNTRDLGGYKTKNGKTTKFNTFIRSDSTDKLTEKDIEKLKNEHNLKTVIDLRKPKEVAACPNKFAEVEGIDYVNAPIYNDDVLPKYLNPNNPEGLEIVYTYFLKNQKPEIKNVLETIANSKDGAVLFHCNWGRDRTGIIAMFLLGLVGVNRQNIIENYTITYDLMKNLDCVKQDVLILGEKKVQTLPEYIETAMNFIEENYGSIENYLISCEISQENLDKIKIRFAEEA